ncbi:hypothetical protein COCMIDRAFT_65871, partial [Bipolaris oryzae ATCC 44560]
TVILGAGVIGLATAYQLALSLTPSEDAVSPPTKIVVIERAPHISPSASGQATGGLGDFGFGSKVANLGILSYNLFQKVAFPNGQMDFGFSDLTVYRITPQDFTGDPKPADTWGPTPPVEQPQSALPRWVRPKENWTVQRMAEPPHGAHLDPGRFCRFLYNECVRLGVYFIFNANATSVEVAKGSNRFSAIHVQQRDQASRKIPCRSIVIAAGPWSPRVFSTLFPRASLHLPMNSTASAGNHFRVRTPGWKAQDDKKGSEQVFLQNDVPGGQGLDITSFIGGELYVGGWGAIPEELPELAESVRAQPTEIQSMVSLAKQYIQVGEDEEFKIYDVGRCYRPLSTFEHPIITNVKWSLLGLENNTTTENSEVNRASSTVGGLFLNTAHFSDGMTLSLGSGRVM